MSPKVDLAKIKRGATLILEGIGEDPQRAGLRGTPDRVARAWRDFIGYKDTNAHTTFEALQVDQMVVVRNIEVWSMCEHHLLPFRCLVTIGYLTEKKVLGLSKFARIAQIWAHRLQLQERLAKDISEHVIQVTGSKHVAVYIEGQHLCMISRGIEAHGSDMVTSVMSGAFKENPQTRAEFMGVLK